MRWLRRTAMCAVVAVAAGVDLLAYVGRAGPSHHPALAATLLGVDADKLLTGAEAGPPVPRDGTLLGGLFESLVTLSVRVYAQPLEAQVCHLRLRDGRHEG